MQYSYVCNLTDLTERSTFRGIQAKLELFPVMWWGRKRLACAARFGINRTDYRQMNCDLFLHAFCDGVHEKSKPLVRISSLTSVEV